MTDTVFVQGVRGANPGADSLPAPLRQSRSSAAVMTQAHGKYHEAASRGNLYIASIPVAGVAPGTALSTAPALTLWNPLGSGLLLSIKLVYLGYISGTLGAGTMIHSRNASQLTAPTGGTAITPVPCNLGSGTATAQAFTGSTISATSTLLRASMILGASLASTAYAPDMLCDEVDGSICVPAGVAWCFQGIAAAGTTPLVMISVVFEEMTA